MSGQKFYFAFFCLIFCQNLSAESAPQTYADPLQPTQASPQYPGTATQYPQNYPIPPTQGPDQVPAGIQGYPDQVPAGIQGYPNQVPAGVQGYPDQVPAGIQGYPDQVPAGVQGYPNQDVYPTQPVDPNAAQYQAYPAQGIVDPNTQSTPVGGQAMQPTPAPAGAESQAMTVESAQVKQLQATGSDPSSQLDVLDASKINQEPQAAAIPPVQDRSLVEPAPPTEVGGGAPQRNNLTEGQKRAIEHRESISKTTRAKKKKMQAEAAITAAQRKKLTKKSVLARIQDKLKKKDGESVVISILTPIDYTSMRLTYIATSTIYKSLAKYGDFNIKSAQYLLPSLTLEEFRKAAIRFESEIVVVAIMKPETFDMFLYDRRTPYYIYMYSEPIPDTRTYRFTKGVATHYIKLLVRRTFYRYILDQYYELPRQDIPNVLLSDVPRRIANIANLTMARADQLSRFYFSGSLGAALSRGPEGKLWNSNSISIQLAVRPFDQFYFEAQGTSFSYYAFMGSIKYLLRNRESPFRFTFGIGGAYVDARRSLNWDQTNGLGWQSKYVVASAGVLLPISDVYLKAETQFYVGLGEQKMIWMLLPGLLLMF